MKYNKGPQLDTGLLFKDAFHLKKCVPLPILTCIRAKFIARGVFIFLKVEISVHFP